ncbi:MAG: dihydropteroate synthase [Pseudomonadota bacterium]
MEVLTRDGPAEIVPADAVDALWPDAAAALDAMAPTRSGPGDAEADWPMVMGVVNVTPDSFSDGGAFDGASAAVDHALALAEQGADILDIGGESTRPGAEPVPEAEEIDRVMPVIEGILASGCAVPISIDTRKASVARAALMAGARIFNDVSALTYDAGSLSAAALAPAICLMHAQGDPRTMQNDPRYDNVVLDVYDYLESRIQAVIGAGIPRSRLIVDPGIGFGKTLTHNVSLLNHLSLFHGLGCALLLGVSRKGFIGRLGGEPDAAKRGPGSIAAGLSGLDQGVHILRVHDVAETVQAVRVWKGMKGERV